MRDLTAGQLGRLIKVRAQPTICFNPQCGNRLKFELLTNESKFVDFQKVRVQETQSELPRGSIPRNLEIILRADTVDLAQPGDRCEFIGTLIEFCFFRLNIGDRSLESKPLRGRDNQEISGVTGLKALGVRELSYRTAFLACTVIPSNGRVSSYFPFTLVISGYTISTYYVLSYK
ncbi:unnamed protein product [Trichobilharzia regenti]|nr:unnamed protein product [Trichobilharzia regenti]